MTRPHVLRCTIESGWPVWSIDCPYGADDSQKPCAMWRDWEDDDPADFTPGCGLLDQWDAVGGDVEAMSSGDLGPIPALVDPNWNGDGWVMVPHKVELGPLIAWGWCKEHERWVEPPPSFRGCYAGLDCDFGGPERDDSCNVVPRPHVAEDDR